MLSVDKLGRKPRIISKWFSLFSSSQTASSSVCIKQWFECFKLFFYSPDILVLFKAHCLSPTDLANRFFIKKLDLLNIVGSDLHDAPLPYPLQHVENMWYLPRPIDPADLASFINTHSKFAVPIIRCFTRIRWFAFFFLGYFTLLIFWPAPGLASVELDRFRHHIIFIFRQWSHRNPTPPPTKSLHNKPSGREN